MVVHRPTQQGLQFQIGDGPLKLGNFAGQLGGETGVLLGHFEHGRQIVRAANGLVKRFDDAFQRFNCPMVSRAASWFSQKPGAPMRCSISFACACLLA